MCQKRPAFKQIALHHSIKPFVEQTCLLGCHPCHPPPLKRNFWGAKPRGNNRKMFVDLSRAESAVNFAVQADRTILLQTNRLSGKQTHFRPEISPPPPRHAVFTYRMSERQTLSESPPVFPHMGAKRVSDKTKGASDRKKLIF